MEEEESSSHRRRPPSRLGLKSAAVCGEIVEVNGGHIVRSTGRKDRHSKVCTAKGPRDRRVRLAAHTAIQFYDVQDRLGYDRPSKAVDWLIKKAKAAIDELAQLPAWHPTMEQDGGGRKRRFEEEDEDGAQRHHHHHHGFQPEGDLVIANSSLDLHQNGVVSGFLPPSMDCDTIGDDTMKSFFPAGNTDEAGSSFQNYSRDLNLSLQSFQDPISLHHPDQARVQGQVLLSGTPVGFDGWSPENHHQHQQLELSRFSAAGASPGFLFSSPSQAQQQLHQLLGCNYNQFVSSQRGPLQSSYTPAVRAWMEPPPQAVEQPPLNHHHHHHHTGILPIFPSSLSGIGFSSGFGGFSGFQVPARIQGDEEEHDGYSDKPSSASSDSRH